MSNILNNINLDKIQETLQKGQKDDFKETC